MNVVHGLSSKLATTIIAIAIAFAALFTPIAAFAQLDTQLEDVRKGAGYTTSEVGTVTGRVINAFLGVLGIVTVVIILIGGFKWMTSGGAEEKVGEARKLMSAGVIGLVIVVAAFAISKFVVQKLSGTGVQDTNRNIVTTCLQAHSATGVNQPCFDTASNKPGVCGYNVAGSPICVTN